MSEEWSDANQLVSEKSAAKNTEMPVAPAADGPGKYPHTDPQLIVAIGCSAGGLEPLEEFLRSMPPNNGMAFVVITHRHPDRKSAMPEILSKCTNMNVHSVDKETHVQPNNVYLLSGQALSIAGGRLYPVDASSYAHRSLPIDFFFQALAIDQKERAVGIILSGSGTDGTLGLSAIRGESGLTIVQSPRTAAYAGMPQSAITHGVADFELEVKDIPKQLVAHAARGRFPAAKRGEADEKQYPLEKLQQIFILLRGRTGHDFSHYKRSTIGRRIERRQNVHQIANIDHYIRFLHENPRETDTLFRELLIGVTSFFRDPEAFDCLATHILPKLIEARPDNHELRVWVTGCSTGEEAYSLAILLRELMQQGPKRFTAQIFATDLDIDAIHIARTARYPEGIAANVNAKRLAHYFSKDDGTYRVRKEIRDMVIFAPHNLLTDPPFTKTDLVSCRNLLIYLDGETQKILFPLFHYSLKPDGILFLGTSETVGSSNDLFSAASKKWKIYTRIEGRTELQSLSRLASRKDRAAKPGEIAEAGNSKTPTVASLIESYILRECTLPTVIVNELNEIVHVHGRVGSYLELPAGKPENKLLNMARDGLQTQLALILRRAKEQEDETIIHREIPVQANGRLEFVDLIAKSIRRPEALQGLVLIQFAPAREPDTEEERLAKIALVSARHDADLELELQYTKEHLQSTVEELEASNEELKSTNEELQSINEELQSTNEELETSKEEGQSLNEELQTVNSELHSKIEELSRTSDDMTNLLNSTDIATIFVDTQLLVKRFTTHARKIINLINTDVGRPVSDIVTQLPGVSLQEYARKVLDELTAQELEVRAADGRWYLMRAGPYRTRENMISGVVFTFIEISELKKADAFIFENTTAFGIADFAKEGLLVLSKELSVLFANTAYYQLFGSSPATTVGRNVFLAGVGEWDRPEFRELLEHALPRRTYIQEWELETVIDTRVTRVHIDARYLTDRDSDRGLILLRFSPEASAS